MISSYTSHNLVTDDNIKLENSYSDSVFYNNDKLYNR